jgi:uncharacterized protein (TIGR04222 family)
MDWLVHNPVADLSGPAFLVAYALFAAAVIVALRLQVRAADTSETLALPPVATERDPYEVAYLRGGGNELLRFTIFDLVRQGFLRICDPPKAGKAPQQIVQTGAGGIENLSGFQREVVTFYAVPHTTAELFKSPLPAQAQAYGDVSYKTALETQRFYSAPEVHGTATLVRLYGALALTAFAAYRLYLAMVKGHNNVIFLVIETAIALLLLLVLTAVPRLSRRGREFLARLATALRPAAAGPVVAGVGVLPILIAATGMGALAGTEYAQMNVLFPRQSSTSSSGCGSSGGSGGGSSCSSGCGGGCGG